MNVDPASAGVSQEEWSRETAHCHPLRVAKVVEETADARSYVLEIPDALAERFRYRAGQFLSFKIPFEGRVLVRSYSLSSCPDTDSEHKFTVKRIEEGRVSNWINDRVEVGDELMVTPPAGFFVLNDETRKLVFFSGGSGITPCISLVKSALLRTQRAIKLVYANRDGRSIIFRDELDALARSHPDRLEICHSLDDVGGFIDLEAVERYVEDDHESDFYLCGPGPFMDTVERGLARLHVRSDQIHIERFVSPPDTPAETPPAAQSGAEIAPDTIEIVLDGASHDVPYREGERVLAAARRAGLDPPFSCEEGYCSCCMAKLREGRVVMAANDCLTPELLEEGWVLTCQSRCVSRKIRIEYPD